MLVFVKFSQTLYAHLRPYLSFPFLCLSTTTRQASHPDRTTVWVISTSDTLLIIVASQTVALISSYMAISLEGVVLIISYQLSSVRWSVSLVIQMSPYLLSNCLLGFGRIDLPYPGFWTYVRVLHFGFCSAPSLADRITT